MNLCASIYKLFDQPVTIYGDFSIFLSPFIVIFKSLSCKFYLILLTLTKNLARDKYV